MNKQEFNKAITAAWGNPMSNIPNVKIAHEILLQVAHSPRDTKATTRRKAWELYKKQK